MGEIVDENDFNQRADDKHIFIVSSQFEEDACFSSSSSLHILNNTTLVRVILSKSCCHLLALLCDLVGFRLRI